MTTTRKRSAECDRLSRAITKHRDAIAKHRDALRALIADADAVAYCCDRAIGDLDRAVDTLSEYL